MRPRASATCARGAHPNPPRSLRDILPGLARATSRVFLKRTSQTFVQRFASLACTFVLRGTLQFALSPKAGTLSIESCSTGYCAGIGYPQCGDTSPRACNAIGTLPNANEQLGDLAGTILTRCLRALQARDEVGFRFYRRQNNTTRSEMLYHFDYLTLLLAGAFDAGARIARLVCGLEDINLRAVNFRSQQFRQALRANGASSLGDVIDNRSFQMFQRFLGALRNSIHGTGLRGVGLDRAGEPEVSLVQVFEDHEDIWEVSAAIGSREDLGVAREAGLGVTVEPYTCAVRLCEIGLEHLNGIAEATDVGRLLTEESRAGLLAGPPEDRIFGSETRRRIGALG